MSQRAIAYVASLHSFLTEGEYGVAEALAHLARDEDDVTDSHQGATMEEIAALAGLTPRRTRQLIRLLESYGLLVSVYQKKGLRRSRTTYTWVELDAERPPARPDTATVISLAKAMRRKAQAVRERAKESRLHGYRDPLLLATVYEEMARALREESARKAQGTGA